METTKRTELIENIIKQYSLLAYRDNKYDLAMVKEICGIIWHTANNELDDICEVKADNEVLERRIGGLEDIVLNNDKQIQSQLSEIENLQQENKELIEELEANKLHLQDTYEEMDRKNQAEYERGLQEGYDDHLNDSNNEH